MFSFKSSLMNSSTHHPRFGIYCFAASIVASMCFASSWDESWAIIWGDGALFDVGCVVAIVIGGLAHRTRRQKASSLNKKNKIKEFEAPAAIEIVPEKHHDFVNMVHTLANYRNTAGFEELMADVRRHGLKFDSGTRSRALDAACSTVCCLDIVKELLRDDDKSIFEGELTSLHFDATLKGLAHRGSLKQCIEIRDLMPLKNLQPTQSTFGSLLSACLRADDVARAKDIFSELLASGLEPNAVHYTTFIKALLRAGRMSEVSSLVEEMEASAIAKPDILTYHLLVKAYLDHHDTGAALRLITRQIERGLKPDRTIYESVLQGLCMKPISSFEILAIFDSMVKKGLEPSTTSVAVVVKALGAIKKWDAALRLLSSVEKRFGLRPEARLYAQLGLASLKANDAQSAARIYEEMLQTVGALGVSSGVMSRLLRDCVQLDISEAKSVAFGNHHHEGSRLLIIHNFPNNVSARLAHFVKINDLDDRCRRLLESLETAKLEWVMDHEFFVEVDKSKGTAAGKVVATVQRVRYNWSDWHGYPAPVDLRRRLDTFIHLNSLPRQCVDALTKKTLPYEELKWVMNEVFVIDATSSTAEKTKKIEYTMALARELNAGGGAAFNFLLEEFISLNQLDDRCAQSLRKIPRADAAWVMDQEWHIVLDQSHGNAAAKVVGLLKNLKAEQHEHDGQSTI